jgi:hypothetical protein
MVCLIQFYIDPESAGTNPTPALPLEKGREEIKSFADCSGELYTSYKEGWSLDEKQTVGGRDAAVESTGKYSRRVCARTDSRPCLRWSFQHITETEPLLNIHMENLCRI